MTKYYLEDFTATPKRKRLIRHREDHLIEQYDFKAGKWVEDSEMLKIYTGEIDVDTITESEAERVIKDREKST